MEIIDNGLLDTVTGKAKENPRLRMNYNFHKSLDAKAQRLLNALEPGTELPIHSHQETAETYIVLRGSLNMLFYNSDKELISKTEICPAKGIYGVDIPAGQWHTIEVLESGTVIFEVKEGPYKPLETADML